MANKGQIVQYGGFTAKAPFFDEDTEIEEIPDSEAEQPQKLASTVGDNLEEIPPTPAEANAQSLARKDPLTGETITPKAGDPFVSSSGTPFSKLASDSFYQLSGIDPLDKEYERIAKIADGSSPLKPIRLSPLSMGERIELVTSDRKGALEKLKEKYEDAQVDRKGNYLVKNEGLWHQVDPEFGGDGDAYEMTKEIMKDIPELVPEGLKLAAGIIGTRFGGSLGGRAAQAGAVTAMELGRTSLGKWLGTYKSTPLEQTRDLGLEFLVNLGSSYIMPGEKPTPDHLAKGLEGINKSLSALPAQERTQAKMALSNNIAVMTQTAPEKVLMAIDNAPEVTQIVKSARNKRFLNEAQEEIKRDSIDKVEQIADNAKRFLNRQWENLSSTTEKEVPNDFKIDSGLVTREVQAPALDSGLFKVVNKEGKELAVDSASFAQKGVPSGYKLEIRSPKELRELQSSNKSVVDLANNKDAYRILKEYFDTVNNLSNFGTLQGKEGFKQVLKMKKTIDGLGQQLQVKAKESGIDLASVNLAQGHANLNNALFKNLDANVGAKLANQMQTWSNARKELSPLIIAREKAALTGDKAVYENFLDKINRKSKIAGKDSFNDAIELMSIEPGSNVGQLARKIQLNDVAKDFLPMIKMAKDVPLLGSFPTSPRMALGAINLVQTPGRLTNAALFKLKDTISLLSDVERDKLLQNPQVLNSLFQSAFSVEDMSNQISDHMLRGGVNAATGGQGNE